MKFKHDIEAQAGFKDKDGQLGSAGQILSSTGSQTDWIDQSTISAGNAEHVVIYAKNTSGASISKGTPVYITGTVGATDTVEIAPADASNSAKMPAVGLLDDTLANNAFGYVITGGFMDNITTDPIDGATPSSNDTVYVKSGGGLTLTKPTGSNLIQNVAKVGKVSGGNAGSLIVSSILRTNDVPNLSTGKIWVGSAANTIESATVHLDETNGRMGIGTPSPSRTLHVKKTGDNEVARFESDQTTSFIELEDANTTGQILLGTQGDDFKIHTAGSERLRVTGSGNVGIGTTSPSQTFTVEKNSGIFRINTSTSTYPRIEIGSSSGTTAAIFNRTTASQNIIFGESSDTGNYIFRGGNVGIGTTSPGHKLHVDGTTKIQATTNATLTFEQSSNVYQAAINSSAHLVLQSAANNSVIFKDGGTTNMTIDGSSGNVGIGTTSPFAQLHVDAGANYPFEVNSTQDYMIGLSRSGTDEWWLKAYTDGRFAIHENGVGDKLTIKAGGNVGIGTTSPGAKLDVVSSSSGSQIELTSPTPGIKLIDSNLTTRYAEIKAENGNVNIDIDPGQAEGTSYFSVDIDNSEKFRITKDGNVGIGTTNPQSKLQLNAGDGLTVTANDGAYSAGYFGRIQSDYGTNALRLVSRAGDVFRATNYGQAVAILTGTTSTGTSERMRITDSGNVGIGTTSPSQKLEVSGNARVTGAYYDSNNSPGTSGQVLSSTATGTDWITLNDTYYTETESDARYVNVTGDTMTGNLTVNGTVIGDGNLFLRSYNNDPKGIFFRDGFEYGDTNQYNLSITVYDDGDGAADGMNINAWDGIYFNVQSGSTPSTAFRILNTEVRSYKDFYTSGDLTVSGGDITLGGTGRIQGIDTVSAGTDAANKLYVDNYTYSQSESDAKYIIGSAQNQSHYIHLNQNPVGTTYGDTVSTVPSYYLGQKAGDNDGWRLYGEAPSSNDVKMVFEVIDDIEAGDTWIFRNKKTYSPYTANDVVIIEGNGDITTDGEITLDGRLRIGTVDTNTSSTSALVLNGTEVEKRILGTAAFSNTGDFVAVTGDTMTGDLTVNANISHQGLTMTDGTDVDQVKTFTMTYQLTADTWTDTGINAGDLSTGTYIMQVFADDHGSGGGHYDEYYSATISWFGTGTNDTRFDEIVVHRAGHAPNNSDLQFRTQRHSSGGDNLMLQVKSNYTHTAAMNNTNGKRHTYKFRRLI